MKVRITDLKGNDWIGEMSDVNLKYVSGWDGNEGELVLLAYDINRTYHLSEKYPSLFVEGKVYPEVQGRTPPILTSLMNYVQHKFDCKKHGASIIKTAYGDGTKIPGDCTCGLTALRQLHS